MQTIQETRRQRLAHLIDEGGGRIADFNEAMGYERTSSKFARILNANARNERDGQPYVMGDKTAREIEDKRGLPRGYMDTPIDPMTAIEDQQILHAVKIMEKMTPYQLNQAVRVIDTLAQPDEPPKSNGTRSQ